jgi:hypothetical protein
MHLQRCAQTKRPPKQIEHSRPGIPPLLFISHKTKGLFSQRRNVAKPSFTLLCNPRAIQFGKSQQKTPFHKDSQYLKIGQVWETIDLFSGNILKRAWGCPNANISLYNDQTTKWFSNLRTNQKIDIGTNYLVFHSQSLLPNRCPKAKHMLKILLDTPIAL